MTDYVVVSESTTVVVSDTTTSVVNVVAQSPQGPRGYGFDIADANTSSTSQTSIYSFSTTYKGAKIVVSVTESTNRYVSELLITHNGTIAAATEYGQVATGSALASFDVDISGSTVRLLATPASSNAMTFDVISTLIS